MNQKKQKWKHKVRIKTGLPPPSWRLFWQGAPIPPLGLAARLENYLEHIRLFPKETELLQEAITFIHEHSKKVKR